VLKRGEVLVEGRHEGPLWPVLKAEFNIGERWERCTDVVLFRGLKRRREKEGEDIQSRR